MIAAMRGAIIAFALGLSVAACATSLPPAAKGPEALRGCWIERGADGTKTMRWRKADAGVWIGEAIYYPENESPVSVGLRLEPKGAGLRMCRVFEDFTIEASCTPAFLGRPAERPHEDWAELYASEDRLVMIGRSGARSTTVFDGARDGCD